MRDLNGVSAKISLLYIILPSHPEHHHYIYLHIRDRSGQYSSPASSEDEQILFLSGFPLVNILALQLGTLI